MFNPKWFGQENMGYRISVMNQEEDILFVGNENKTKYKLIIWNKMSDNRKIHYSR